AMGCNSIFSSASLFDRCSSSSPCESPSVCFDNSICLPPEAPTPVFASAPFSLPLHDSPQVLTLPPGLLPDYVPQRAIFLPPARISHPAPEFRPITRVFPVISRVVGDPALVSSLAARPLQAPERPHFHSYVTPPEPRQETQESATLPTFSPSFSPDFAPSFSPSLKTSPPSQLSLPTARQIRIDEVMEEQLPKAKP
ncbi:hypothetical protein PENTCL1PPCAC_9890, partial [Pristionchus entomophagus]